MANDGEAVRRNGHPTLHEEVVSWLRDRIVEGEFEPGSHVPERLICERLGISRTPLREAYKVLASEHLLTLLPNRGAVVARLSTQDVEDAMQMMATLEGLAGELLCARISDAEIGAIRSLHEEMVGHHEAGRLMDYFKINQRIHDELVKASGNALLLKTYLGVGSRFRRFRYAGNRAESRWRRAVLEHEQILMVIEDRDGELLGHLMRAHVRNGWKVVKDSLRTELEPE